MEVGESLINSENNLKDLNETKTRRELELEEMLNGLKEKFLSLSANYPLRLRILTIAPSSWSERQILLQFGSSRHYQKNQKN